MSNEEFQKKVLESLSELKIDMKYVKDKVRIIEEQTKTLSEFRHTVIESAKDFSKKIS
jgi:septation ring formation regulator EzrA